MKNIKILLITASLILIPLISLGNASAASIQCQGGKIASGGASGANGAQYCCGGDDDGNSPVAVSINFGCQGKGNPIMDMLFAFIKLLSDGVGLVVIASMIVAGIQYTSSRGDPQATAKAISRIQSNVTALFLFIFAYAILNYLIPGQFLK